MQTRTAITVTVLFLGGMLLAFASRLCFDNGREVSGAVLGGFGGGGMLTACYVVIKAHWPARREPRGFEVLPAPPDERDGGKSV